MDKRTWLIIGMVVGLGLWGTVWGAPRPPRPPVETSVGSRADDGLDSVAQAANDGRIIDSILIINRNVYDTRDPRYSGFLFRTANKLHYVSRPTIVRRELLLEVGKKFSTQEAEETARNLRSRYYLYDAWVETERLPNGHLLVRVVTIDQWSLVGGFQMSREGNRSHYKLGFEERNLLGLNQFLSFDYNVQEADKNYVKWVFSDPRFFGLPYSGAAEFNTDPHNEAFILKFGKPFYNLEQRFAFDIKYGDLGGRFEHYVDESLKASWQSSADAFEIRTAQRWGTHFDKMGLTEAYIYHANHISDRRLFAPPDSSFSFPVDSLYHRPSVGFELTHYKFTRLRRISGFAYLEDFTLATGAAIEGSRAYKAGFGGYYYDRLDFHASYSRQLDSSLFFITYDQTYWMYQWSQLRHFTELVTRYYNTNINWVTFASRFIYRSDRSKLNDLGVVLGGKAGIRGYDEIARTGSRMAALNLECRFYPNLEFLSVIFGGVLFADFGRAWKIPDAVSLYDLEYSLGAGLRISLEKATKSELIRIDVARTREGSWNVAFGTGQYF